MSVAGNVSGPFAQFIKEFHDRVIELTLQQVAAESKSPDQPSVIDPSDALEAARAAIQELDDRLAELDRQLQTHQGMSLTSLLRLKRHLESPGWAQELEDDTYDSIDRIENLVRAHLRQALIPILNPFQEQVLDLIVDARARSRDVAQLGRRAQAVSNEAGVALNRVLEIVRQRASRETNSPGIRTSLPSVDLYSPEVHRLLSDVLLDTTLRDFYNSAGTLTSFQESLRRAPGRRV